MARTVAVNLAIKGVAAVVGGFTEVGAASTASAKTLEKNAQAAGNLGSSMLKMGGLAAGGMVLLAKAAMDWQSEWTGVAKTVNGTNAELDALQGNLRQMAKEIPASTEAIAAVAENAGQLGIATGNIAAFTRVMIDLGNTTNLSADEASSSLAQFMNIMQTAGPEVDRLGATVVALGNNGASTEKDIVAMGLRIAGAGKAVGLTEAQTLAYASALSSVGIAADAGGTAMSQSFLKIDAAVRAGSGGLELLAQTSGMSADEFAKAWAVDAAGATNTFLKGLAKIQAQGGSVTDVLKDLGMGGIREADAMRRLAMSGDLLTESLQTGSDAWRDNTALVVEATKRYETAESKSTVAWNSLKDDAISAGQVLLPQIAGLAESVSGLAGTFGALPQPVKAGGVAMLETVTVLALMGGGMLKAYASAQKLLSNLQKLPAGYASLGPALAIAAAAFIALSVAQSQWAEQADRALTKSSDLAAKIAAGLNTTDLNSSFNLKSSIDQVSGLDDALIRLQASRTDMAWLAGITNMVNGSGLKMATAQMNELDKAMASFAQVGNAAKAAETFNTVAATAAKYGQTNIDVMANFPQYKAMLEQQAIALGQVQLSEQEYADWMGGKIPPAIAAAQSATDKGTKSIQAQTTSLNDLTDALFSASSAALKTSGSAIGFEAAIDDATKAAKENGRNLDINTEKGRANRTALDQQAEAAQAYVSQLTKSGAETSVLVATTQRARDTFIANAKAMGMTEAQAKALADQYGLVPKDVPTIVSAPGASEARGSVEDLLASLDKLKPPVQAYIQTILRTEGVTAAYAAKKDLESHPIIIPVQIVVPKNVKIGTGSIAISSADGNLFKAYASGGFENHVAQIARGGAMRLWAEPETKGEAYIPLAQEKWPRSREIWWETGKHLGLVAHADGAMYSGGRSPSPAVNVGSPTANVYVQAIPDGEYVRHEARVVFSQESASMSTAQRRNRK